MIERAQEMFDEIGHGGAHARRGLKTLSSQGL
jgi:hypothetical protein